MATAAWLVVGCSGDSGPQEVDWDGWSRALERRSGLITVVLVWAPWSRPSLEALPAVVELAREYEGAPVRFLAAGVDAGRSRPLEFSPMSDFRLQLEPTEALARLGIQDPPAAFVYGSDGALLWRLTLEERDPEFTPANLADAVDQALASDGAR